MKLWEALEHPEHADARKQSRDFTRTHHQAISDYKEDHRREINSELRTPIEDKHPHEHTVKALDHVTGKKTTKDYMVHRGLETHASKQLLSKPAGHKFTDRGFTSASHDEKVARGYAIPHKDGTKHIARIHAPAGTRGHSVDYHHKDYSNRKHPDLIHSHGHEREFLFHRGTTFKVAGHSYDEKTKTHYTDLHVHHQEHHE